MEPKLIHEPDTGKFYYLYHCGLRKEVGTLNKKLGYVVIRYMGKLVYAHRLMWYMIHGSWPDFIDHINGIRNDNRIINLRNVTKQMNHTNMVKFVNNTSGAVGVSKTCKSNKWRANIRVKGKQVFLGHFNTFDDAVIARKQAEVLYGFHENHGRPNNS